MFTFYIKNHGPFGPLRRNCPKLGKNKNIVSIFSGFIAHKSTFSTVQLCRMFQFSSVNVCICTSISWYFYEIDQFFFRAGKNSPTTSLFFNKMTAEVSRNNCAKRHKDLKPPWYILDISKLAGSKLTRFRVCLSLLQCTPLQDWKFDSENNDKVSFYNV